MASLAQAVAGLAVTVQRAEVQHEVALREAARARRTMALCFRPWATLAWSAGPARRAALAAVRREARVVLREVKAAYGAAGVRAVGEDLVAARAAACRWVELRFPAAGERACAEWRIAMAVRQRAWRWWVRRRAEGARVCVQAPAWRAGFWHALHSGEAEDVLRYAEDVIGENHKFA